MLASEADSMPQVYPLIGRVNIVARKRADRVRQPRPGRIVTRRRLKPSGGRIES